jgi:hypothetical protein
LYPSEGSLPITPTSNEDHSNIDKKALRRPKHWIKVKNRKTPRDGASDRLRIAILHEQTRTTLSERSNPRFRSGQTRERIPSNAWARKIAAPIKPITAVIVSNITNVPLRYCATENGGDLAQSKRFPGTNTQSRPTEDYGQQTCIVL